MAEDLFARTAANRRLAADLFASLTDEQWATPSLCAGWTVRVLAGHMLMNLEISFASFLLLLLRERGSFDRTSDRASRRLAAASALTAHVGRGRCPGTPVVRR